MEKRPLLASVDRTSPTNATARRKAAKGLEVRGERERTAALRTRRTAQHGR